MSDFIKERQLRVAKQPFSDRELAKKRSHFYRIIRNFFDDQDYVEVETPILSSHLIPESAIEVFETTLHHPHRQADKLYLCPSPELYMKVLISEGIGNCYQLTKSFRNAEHYSSKHFAEFTMLEWYTMDCDYLKNIENTQRLLLKLAPHADPDTRHLFERFTEITMSDIFQQKTGISLKRCNTLEEFKKAAIAVGFSQYAEQAECWEELFNLIFISHIETELPGDRTVFLKDYPAQIPTTAKASNDPSSPHNERWELYMKGWEIANCFTEEPSYQKMLSLFKSEAQEKASMMTPHPVDYDYLNIFNKDFPACSGVALGIDRLFVIFLNLDTLDEATLFPFSDQLK